MKPTFLLIVAGAILSLPSAHAQLIDSYNADTGLTVVGDAVTSWTDETGSENATASSVTEGKPFGSYTLNYEGDPTAANSNATFGGHTYVNFGAYSGLLTADPLFSGSSDRSVAAVYDVPSGDNGGVNSIAGESVAPQEGADWFMLQSRDEYVAGDPYLAGDNDDVNPGTTPAANRLTFAIGTYNSSTEVETLYWAYGLFGAVHSQSMQLGTMANPALDTTATPFTMGFDADEPSLGNMQIGQVLVYENALSSTAATDEIEALQVYYGAPEPSTYALTGISLLIGVVFLRRRTLA